LVLSHELCSLALGLLESALEAPDLLLSEELAGLDLIVATLLEVIDDLGQIADLLRHGFIPAFELSDKLLQVRAVDISRVPRLADPQQLLDFPHLLAQPVVLSIEELVLLS
jgi:hypothetical protein